MEEDDVDPFRTERPNELRQQARVREVKREVRVAEAGVDLQGKAPGAREVRARPYRVAKQHRIDETWGCSTCTQPSVGRSDHLAVIGRRRVEVEPAAVRDDRFQPDGVAGSGLERGRQRIRYSSAPGPLAATRSATASRRTTSRDSTPAISPTSRTPRISAER